MPKCFSLTGFCHLYRSILRFLPINPFEAKALVYLLNIANIDTCYFAHPYREYKELSESDFYRYLDQNIRSYHTEVQLYKSMQTLCSNIHWEVITEVQRYAVMRTRTLMKMLVQRFRMVYGCDIDAECTTYEDCCWDLLPGRNEPMVSLENDNTVLCLFLPNLISKKLIEKRKGALPENSIIAL